MAKKKNKNHINQAVNQLIDNQLISERKDPRKKIGTYLSDAARNEAQVEMDEVGSRIAL